MKPKESGKRQNCEKDFISRQHSGCALPSGLETWAKRSVAPVLTNEPASLLPRSPGSFSSVTGGGFTEAYSYASGEGVREGPNFQEGLWLEKQ